MADCLCRPAKNSVTNLLLVTLAPPPTIVNLEIPDWLQKYFSPGTVMSGGWLSLTGSLSVHFRHEEDRADAGVGMGRAEAPITTAAEESSSGRRSISKA